MIASDVKYKKTGINWMLEVPEHWDIVRLKNVSRIVSGATPKSSVSANWDGNINWVTPAEFGDEMYIGESVRKITKTGLQSCAASLVPIGSIILSNRAPIGSLGISKVELSTNQGCKSIIPTHINNYFLYFLMTLQKENLNVLGNGTTFRELATPSLRNYKIPFPPREEQDKIASHLYYENEKITNFIQTKQRFIELLKEQRQSIITNAVTKGIDEKAKMKETVLGEIPQHWEVRRLKTFVSSSTNGVWGSEPKNNDDDVYCIRVADIDALTYGISEQKLTIRNISKEDQCNRLLKKGDLIIEKSGGGELSPVGRIVIFNLDHKAVTSNFMARLNIVKEVDSEYLYFLFSSLYSQRKNIPAIKATTGIQNIDLYEYLQIKVGVPQSNLEQQEIIKHIKTETKTLDIAISKAEREIELIKEYREAMIAEAVTGKMKL
jgi:type I restriction enzyme S subunit